MERDFNGFPPFMDYGMGMPPQGGDMNDMYRDPMFNPMLQYEQAYCYYRCLCMQMDYKIKCKEYEKLFGGNGNGNSRAGRTGGE